MAKGRIPALHRPPTGRRTGRRKSADMSLMATVRRNRWQGIRAPRAPIQVLTIVLVLMVVLLGTKELHGRPLEGVEIDAAKDVAVPQATALPSEVNPPATPPGPPDQNEPHVVESGVIDNVVRSCPVDQPLVRMFPGFLPSDTFGKIREGLLRTADKKDASLFKANFGYTSGWMVRFNAQGTQKFKSDPRFEFTIPFFEKALNPDANAFVMNLLICYEPAEEANAVEYHVDNSVGIKNSIARDYTLVAHQVNVLYIDIPEGMEGGALEVWPFENQLSEFGKAIISPAKNLMAEFRGDAFHRVGRMKLDGASPRVGLVFEQYQISSEFYPYTTEFCFGDECAAIQDD